MPVNPKVTEVKGSLSVDRLTLRVSGLKDGNAVGGRTSKQFNVVGIVGSPENQAKGSPGDVIFRLDEPGIWQKLTGEGTKTGWSKIPGSSSVSVCDVDNGLTYVECFGATADGVTDDTLAIRAAITAAGTNGVVVFESGTYIVSGALVPLSGQQFVGYHKPVLKRRDQVSGVTDTSIVSGVTNSIVMTADPVLLGFVVGMDIVVEKGGSYDNSSRTIVDITGNTVTVSTTFGVALSGPDINVHNAFYVLLYNTDDVLVEGLSFDGNAANSTFARWPNTGAIRLSGSRNIVRDCYIFDSPGEGILIGGTGTVVEDCAVLTTSGNSIHFSGNSHAILRNCRLVGSNTDLTVGHADGVVTLSDSTDDILVEGNYIADSQLAGIGSWDASSNSSLAVVNNVFRDCVSNVIEAVIPSSNTQEPENFIFSGNRIYDCGPALFNSAAAAPTTFLKQIIVSGNLFSQTLMSLNDVRNMVVSGNTFDLDGNTTDLVILIDKARYLLIEGNIIIGGARSIFLGDTDTENVLVVGNTMRDFDDFGFYASGGPYPNCSVLNNDIRSGATVIAGINCSERLIVKGNTVTIVAGTDGIICANHSIVQGNTVRKGAATNSIRAFGGSTGVIIVNNQVDAAVNGGNVVRDNDLIAA